LTQDFGAAGATKIANKLRDNGVDGEILSELTIKQVEQYLGFNHATATKIHDAIHPLLGLADLTNTFAGQKENNVVAAEGKQCLVRCCCVDSVTVSLPGGRRHCQLRSRQITWRELSPVGLRCGAIGSDWHSYNYWKNGKCLVSAREAMDLRTCSAKSAGTLTSAEMLLLVLVIIAVVGSLWFCRGFIHGGLILTWRIGSETAKGIFSSCLELADRSSSRALDLLVMISSCREEDTVPAQEINVEQIASDTPESIVTAQKIPVQGVRIRSSASKGAEEYDDDEASFKKMKFAHGQCELIKTQEVEEAEISPHHGKVKEASWKSLAGLMA
jgi:hypothetical protein